MQKVMLDLGWEGDVDEMWTDFAKQCKSAATGVPYEVVDASCTEIDKDEVLALYSSPTYSTEFYCARAAEEIIDLLKTLFDAADTDGSGTIPGEALQGISEACSLEAVPAFLSSIDTFDRNKDNQISFSELAVP